MGKIRGAIIPEVQGHGDIQPWRRGTSKDLNMGEGCIFSLDLYDDYCGDRRNNDTSSLLNHYLVVDRKDINLLSSNNKQIKTLSRYRHCLVLKRVVQQVCVYGCVHVCLEMIRAWGCCAWYCAGSLWDGDDAVGDLDLERKATPVKGCLLWVART